MLTYLLGDVLRIYAGDFKPGEIAGRRVTQILLLGIAMLMAVPIVMVFLSLTQNYPVNRWTNIIAAIIFIGFNLLGLPTYRSEEIESDKDYRCDDVCPAIHRIV